MGPAEGRCRRESNVVHQNRENIRCPLRSFYLIRPRRHSLARIAIDLSSEIEPQTVIAELLAGVLTVSMRKACASAKATTHESHSKSAPSRSGQLRKQAGIAKRYAAAAKEQRERATAKQKKARARAVAGHKDADHRSEDLIPCASDSPRDFEAGVLAAARG